APSAAPAARMRLGRLAQPRLLGEPPRRETLDLGTAEAARGVDLDRLAASRLLVVRLDRHRAVHVDPESDLDLRLAPRRPRDLQEFALVEALVVARAPRSALPPHRPD